MKPPSGARVLCVDDNSDVAEAMVLELRRGGHECVAILESADQLAEAILTHDPEIVLLDLDMPGPDPLEVLAHIASRHTLVRFLVVSGHVRRDLIERALEAGAWGYLSKTDETLCITTAIDEVRAGRVVLGPDARQILGS